MTRDPLNAARARVAELLAEIDATDSEARARELAAEVDRLTESVENVRVLRPERP